MSQRIILIALLGCAAPSTACALDLLAFTDGAQPGDMLGTTVAAAGDLDADGRADWAAAATASDAGGSGAGIVFLFLGGYPPDGSPDQGFTGVAGDLMGSALAGAGDLNDDGFDDFAAGSWRNSTGGNQAGKAVILFGGDPLDGTIDRTLLGSVAGGNFGRAVAGAGDLNGDGVDDLAIGAPGEGAGKVYVYFGGNPFDTTPDLTLSGTEVGERFGIALAGPGDLNGDGWDDLAAGSDRSSAPGAWAGKVRLFWGGPGVDSTPDLTLAGESAGSFFGSAVAGAGDVDGDGEADLVVGAKGYNGPATDSGRATLFLGGSDIDATPDLTITGGALEEFLGTSVGGGADLNRDGRSDLVIGVPGTTADRGAVRVYWGGLPLDNVVDVTLAGEAGGDQMGFSVAAVPDVDRNGAGEALCGAWGHAAQAGRAYLYGDSAPPPIAVEPAEAALPAFAVGPARPNPFARATELALLLEREARVTADLRDALGRPVARLLDRRLAAGSHTLRLDGAAAGGGRLAAGVYFLRVTSGADTRTRKLVVLP